MRISDWSSDVCSSDLAEEGDVPFAREADAGDLAFGPALAEAAGHEDAVHRLEIGGEVVVGLEHLCVQPADVDLDPVRHAAVDQRLVEALVGIGQREDRKSTRLNSRHSCATRMPSSD